jgi:hypothetical protein
MPGWRVLDPFHRETTAPTTRPDPFPPAGGHKGGWWCVIAAGITVAGLTVANAAVLPSSASASSRSPITRSHSQSRSPSSSAALTHSSDAPYVPAVGAYFGASPSFEVGPVVAKAVELGDEIHRSLGVVSFFDSWNGPVLTNQFAAVATQGSIPMVSMHCTYPDPAVVAGEYDSQIKEQAQAYAAYGGPVLLRWFWEMNWPTTVNQNGYCLGAGTAAQMAAGYVAAYIHIWKIFQAAGATNVAFVWAPSAAKWAPSATPFYPGSQYVNWIGADIYDRPGYGTFAQMFAGFYAEWSGQHKPMILAETGSIGAPAQVAWLSSIASSFPTQFPLMHALVYTDALTDPQGDYMLEPGGTGMAEFVTVGADPYFNVYQAQSNADADGDGYAITTAAGSVYTYRSQYFGSVESRLNQPIVGMAAPGNEGYWLVAGDGGMFTFGDARYLGSTGDIHLNKPIVGMAAATGGDGYWLVASDGGLFTFGDAKFHGSTGAIHLNKPIVGMAVAPGGGGYWLVASDGGIFTFGDATYRGSTGAIRLNSPIVAMAATPNGGGYWLAAADGGVFCFGNAHYLGSLAGTKLSAPVVGMSVDPVSGQYRLVTAAGAVYGFPGGELSVTPDPDPVVAIVDAA